jgi:hypothetical protein
LQKQISLLRADKDAEYFLFDDKGSPVRFESDDYWIRRIFRIVRGEAFDHENLRPGPDVLAEYLIKVMASTPGLSRQRILAQFDQEYGVRTSLDVAALELEGTMSRSGATQLEIMSRQAPDFMTTALLQMDGMI